MKTPQTIAPSLLLLIFLICAHSQAEEKSIWHKFVDFFSPTPVIEGEGPLYDELRDLNNKISKTEGKYSRERRPGNKARLRKELDKLNDNREILIKKIKEEERKKNISSSSNFTSSHSIHNSINSIKPCKLDTILIRDTIFIKDTVVIHDTLYVIVANKRSTEPTIDSTQESNNN